MSDHPPDPPPSRPWTPPDAPPGPRAPGGRGPGGPPDVAGAEGLPAGPAGGGRRAAAVLAVVAAALLVLGLVLALVLAAGDGTDPGTPPATDTPTEATEPPDPPPGADPGDGLDAVVTELSAFVEAERELEFLRPVPVALLEGDAFRARLLEGFEDNVEDLRRTGRVLRALRLIGPDVDLPGVLERFLGEAALGFYDAEAGELVVRAADPTPFARIVLVHELVHALDDQHFGLDRDELDEADDESAYAFSALVEGTAMTIEQRYRRSLGSDERRAAEREERAMQAGIDLEGVPQVVPDILMFPYFAGPEFVAALLRAGGWALVDQAFTRPPTTSTEILDPRRWLEGWEPVDVPAPPADGEVLDEGVIGRWSLVLVLGEAIGAADAFAAAAGWAGDWSVVWDDGDATCLRAAFATDSARARAALGDALERWAAWHGTARVAADGDLIVTTACG